MYNTIHNYMLASWLLCDHLVISLMTSSSSESSINSEGKVGPSFLLSSCKACEMPHSNATYNESRRRRRSSNDYLLMVTIWILRFWIRSQTDTQTLTRTDTHTHTRTHTRLSLNHHFESIQKRTSSCVLSRCHNVNPHSLQSKVRGSLSEKYLEMVLG